MMCCSRRRSLVVVAPSRRMFFCMMQLVLGVLLLSSSPSVVLLNGLATIHSDNNDGASYRELRGSVAAASKDNKNGSIDIQLHSSLNDLEGKNFRIQDISIQGTRHLETTASADQVSANETVQRCFKECLIQELSPEDCKIYIMQQIQFHPLASTIVVEIVPPKIDATTGVGGGGHGVVIPTIKIPTDIHGYVACDHHGGIMKYPFEWTLLGDTEPIVNTIAAQCAGMLASECCFILNELTHFGRNTDGQCLHCIAVQQPLIPIVFTDGTTGFQDYTYVPDAPDGNTCQPKVYTTTEVNNIDLAAKELSKIDENFVRELRTKGSISCHELAELERRLIVHTRNIPAAERYVGGLVCQFCHVATGEFVGHFEVLLALLAEAFYQLELTVVNSAVTKIYIYTELSINGQVIVGIPQISTTRDPDGELDDCDEEPEVPVVDPNGPPDGGGGPPPDGGGPPPDGGTPPDETVDDPIQNTNVCKAIDVNSNEGYSLSNAGELRQQCRSTLPNSLNIATANIVKLVKHEYFGGDGSDEEECRTRMTYQICNFMYSVGKRRRHLLDFAGGGGGFRGAGAGGTGGGGGGGGTLGGFMNRGSTSTSLSNNESSTTAAATTSKTSSTTAVTAPAAPGVVTTTSTPKTTTTTGNPPPPQLTHEGDGNDSKGHVMLGWTGSCKVLQYGLVPTGAASDAPLNPTTVMLTFFDGQADPETCMTGLKVDGHYIKPKTEEEGGKCVEVAIDYSGHVDVTLPSSISNGSGLTGATLAYHGTYKALSHLPIADCRHISTTGSATSSSS